MNPSKEPLAPSAKHYTPSFKQEALALIAAGRSRSQISRELGVSIWTLRDCKRHSAQAPSVLSGLEAAEAGPSRPCRVGIGGVAVAQGHSSLGYLSLAQFKLQVQLRALF